MLGNVESWLGAVLVVVVRTLGRKRVRQGFGQCLHNPAFCAQVSPSDPSKGRKELISLDKQEVVSGLHGAAVAAPLLAPRRS